VLNLFNQEGMKNTFITIVVLLVSVNAFSQVGIGIGSGGAGIGLHFPINKKKQRMENVEQKVQQIKEDLHLDSSQVLKVRSLMVERERKKHKREPMRREEFNRRMNEILTDEQKIKFKEMYRKKSYKESPQKTSNVPDSTSSPDIKEAEWDDVYR
jgi:hypothetical protein